MLPSILSIRSLRSNRSAKLIDTVKRYISSSQITIERVVDKSRFDSRPNKEDLSFGTTLSDHMLMIEWTKEHQWHSPKVVPYGNLSISPAATCLNYGMQPIPYESL